VDIGGSPQERFKEYHLGAGKPKMLKAVSKFLRNSALKDRAFMCLKIFTVGGIANFTSSYFG